MRSTCLVVLSLLAPLLAGCAQLDADFGTPPGSAPGLEKPTRIVANPGPNALQAVIRFAVGQAKGIRFVSTHKTSGEGGFLVDEYQDETGAAYEVAQPTNEVTYFNTMRGGAIANGDTRPAIPFEQAEQVALAFAREHVRGFDNFLRVASYGPEPNGKGNTFTFEWIGNQPAPRAEQYHVEGIPVPPPPYRVLIVINSKGDLINFLNDTY